MKKYIKPAIAEVNVESEGLMNVGSPTQVSVLNSGNGGDALGDDLDLDWDEE